MVGIDEVGRGCLAGPLLVVAAKSKRELPAGLKDSKLLTRLARETFYKELIELCEWGEGWVTPAEINKFGLARALRLGVRRSIYRLQVGLYEEIIFDGTANYIPARYIKGRCEAGADNRYPVVSAASIIAKVTRDRYMHELAKKYPEYAFEQHVGYGTKQHQLLINKYGPLKNVHRTVFAPFARISTEPLT